MKVGFELTGTLPSVSGPRTPSLPRTDLISISAPVLSSMTISRMHGGGVMGRRSLFPHQSTHHVAGGDILPCLRIRTCELGPVAVRHRGYDGVSGSFDRATRMGRSRYRYVLPSTVLDTDHDGGDAMVPLPATGAGGGSEPDAP